MEKFLPIIRKTHIFSGLSEEEILSVLDCVEARVESYAKDSYLLRIGDNVEAVGLVLAGSVLIFQDDFWGNRNIMSGIGAGQIFGEVFACSPGALLTVNVVADSPCRIMWLNVKKVLTMCPKACTMHSRIIRNLLSDMAEKNLRLNKKMSHLAHRTTRQKLLSYLSEEAIKAGKDNFEISFNRQQLADYLSVDRSAMSNELSKLRDEGMIEFEKNKFALVSQWKL